MSTENILYELLKAGLWGTAPILIESISAEQWKDVKRLADEQTISGLIFDGLNLADADKRPSKEFIMQWFAHIMMIEKANTKMNLLIPKLASITKGSVLLKGQRVARCYKNPAHRQSGDIDLFFYRQKDYENAKEQLSQIADHIGGEEKDRKHFDCTLQKIVVELHGEIKTQIKSKTDKNITAFLKNHFDNYSFDINEETGYCAAPINFDCLFIFVHMLVHYFSSGVGLRQICDWMAYMSYYHQQINQEQLKADILLLGLMKEWQVFGNMAVNFLGFPQEKMPFFENKYKKAGEKVLQQIMKSGNFGRNLYFKNRPKNYILGKLYTFYQNNKMRMGNLLIFPQESLYGIPYLIKGGIRRLH